MQHVEAMRPKGLLPKSRMQGRSGFAVPFAGRKTTLCGQIRTKCTETCRCVFPGQTVGRILLRAHVSKFTVHFVHIWPEGPKIFPCAENAGEPTGRGTDPVGMRVNALIVRTNPPGVGGGLRPRRAWTCPSQLRPMRSCLTRPRWMQLCRTWFARCGLEAPIGG